MIKVEGMTTLLQVFSMPQSLAFYRDILGFQVVNDSGNADDSSWVWLRLDGCDLMLNDQYEPGSVPAGPPAERTKWHKDTCLYFDADPDGAYEHLLSKGVKVEPPLNTAYGMRQLYVTDPDGYNLCFQRSSANE
ncbi:MAG: VOC family protein [Pyrinomonadaceae bacterium]